MTDFSNVDVERYFADRPTRPDLDYALSIVLEEVSACHNIKLAAQRHLLDFHTAKENGRVFKPEVGISTIRYIEKNCIIPSKLTGKLIRCALFPWQKFWIMNKDSWFLVDEHLGHLKKRFNRMKLVSGKGSSKSPLFGAICLKALATPSQVGIKMNMIASKYPQTMASFEPVLQMWEANRPAFPQKMFYLGGSNPYAIVNPLSYGQTNELRRYAKSASGKGVSGPIADWVIIDEMSDIVDKEYVDSHVANLKSSNSLVMIASNTGSIDADVFNDEYNTACDVLRGEAENDRYFALLFGSDDGDDPLNDPDCWIKSNPSWPVLPPRDYLETRVREARSKISMQGEVSRVNFCIVNTATSYWCEYGLWKEAQVKKISPIQERIQRPMWMSADLSRKTDLTGLNCVWDMGDHYESKGFLFTHSGRLEERSRTDRIDYQAEADKGNIILTPGDIIDFTYIVKLIQDYFDLRCDIQGLAYDPRYMSQLIIDFRNQGIYSSRIRGQEAIWLIPHSQSRNPGNPNFSDKDVLSSYDEKVRLFMPVSINLAEEILIQKRILIEENPLWTRGVLSAVIDSDAFGNRIFVKGKANTRIDAALAFVMSLGAAETFKRQEAAAALDGDAPLETGY